MADCQILFHSDRKKAIIYNSLRLGKSKKLPTLSQKTKIKTTDIKPICCKSNKDNNTIKYSNKSDKNINGNK